MYFLSCIDQSNVIKSPEIFYNNYGWSSIISHQNTYEIDYLSPCNKRVFHHAWDRFFERPALFTKKKKKNRKERDRPFLTFPTITDGRHDATSERHMINREPRCESATRSGPPVFLFLFRSTRAVPGIANAPASRCTQMAYELRGSVHACARMYGCWPAAEYNSGNTLELGQSCFDARLRNFHLCAARKFIASTSCDTVRVITSWAISRG